jgi:DNA polymerase
MTEVDLALRDVVASARLLVSELVDEGVDGFTRVARRADRAEGLPAPEPDHVPVPPQARPAPAAAPAAPPGPRPADLAPGAPADAPPTAAPPAWGEHPTLDAVRAVLGDCRRCALCERRTKIVFGDGHPDADILFVGEGPGENEDLQGLPFVGRAGELLTQMIEKGMGIPRSDVYICNIVKCRPPNNRNPLPPEVAACRPFLDGQIDAVAPRVIVSLGKPAASLLLGRDVAITRLRGTWQSYRGIPLMPTLHPAFVLRQYTAENRRAVWEDLKKALAKAREH